MKRVLVTGAAGGVGHRVSGILRSMASTCAGWCAQRTIREGSRCLRRSLTRGYVQDPGCVGAAMDGVDTVVHCAAVLPDASLETRLVHEVNVEGTRIVMREAVDRGV